MDQTWFLSLIWVVAGGLVGFLVTSVFSGRLHWPRRLFLIPYVGFVGAFLLAYCVWSRLDGMALIRENWVWGVLGALAVGAFVVRNVRSQPKSARTQGAQLAFDLFWMGGVYGALDGLYLSVFPILAAWNACAALGWTVTWPGRIAAGGIGLLASLFLAVAYHLGYPEFRGQRIFVAMLGNGIFSLGALLTANPLTAVLSHAAMHMAAVLHGPDTTVQLPPHEGAAAFSLKGFLTD